MNLVKYIYVTVSPTMSVAFVCISAV